LEGAPLRSFLCDALGSVGYVVTQCANGSEAVEYYGDHAAEVNVVLLDVMMPEMNRPERHGRGIWHGR